MIIYVQRSVEYDYLVLISFRHFPTFSEKVKDFLDLSGCKWAYNDDLSLSGNLAVLAELKRRGFNASFFGNIVCSGTVPIYNIVQYILMTLV